MFKKKKIREEFDEVFKAGDEGKIKEMLDENPWLLEEVSHEMNEVMGEEQQIIAALGVMEDELGGTAPLNEIILSLKVDFEVNKSEDEVLSILENLLSLELVKKHSDGWSLTNEGARICDDYLNQNLEGFDI
ncbi:MAG: hypothetical protein BAJALOKI3v1_610008 [Promethearchaeota archaeon]|jgi:hypothetical protein|nr:MAG: hypothetical protein BAJALOKI3v1_610008 [Candidatus Lokiarchaeota archaeon]